MLSFLTLEFLSHCSKYWNSYLILPIIRVFILSFQTLEFSSYPCKDQNSYLILPNIRILILCFQRLEFLSYSTNHQSFYLILPNIRIFSQPSKHQNSYLFFRSLSRSFVLHFARDIFLSQMQPITFRTSDHVTL